MIELVIIACLSASPTQCDTHRIGMGDGLMGCVMASQASASKWASEHTKHTVKRVVCRPMEIDA